MENQKTREEVKEEDTWDLTDLYKTDGEFEKDLTIIQKDIEKIKNMKDIFLTNTDTFLECLDLELQLDRTITKAYIYAGLKLDEDQGNSKSQERKGKVEQLYNKAVTETAFMKPAILDCEEEKIRLFLKDDRLKNYRHDIEDMLRYKKHTLSQEEEKILANYSTVFSFPDKTASYLRNVDLQFGVVKDEEGNDIELTSSSYSLLIMSSDRNVRKNAFEQLYRRYASVKNTLSSTYEATLEKDVVNAKVRGYQDSLSMYLFGNKIDKRLYEQLIATVRKHLPTLFSYFDLKKDILGVEELHLYDTYAPLVEKSKNTYSFEEARKMVVEALSVLGDEYVSLLNTAFDNRWIDKYPNKGKRSGAYSWGCYDSVPHVLLNYDGTMNAVSTIAHELGHSMHSYYSCKYNNYQDHDYVIFLAEIASTVNEMLFYHYFLNKTTDKEEKLAVLNEMLDMFKATIFRQTMFAEFELQAHQARENGTVLTPDFLNQLYYQLNQDYFGNNVVVDEEIQYEWLRIPHFYTPFYVYQYATGLSVACYVAKNILENRNGFKEKYLEFLKTGGRDYPLELLKVIDVSMEDGGVIEEAIQFMEKLLSEFKNTYNEK